MADMGSDTDTGKTNADRTARSSAAIRASAGAWKDIDANELKSAIRERRRTGSRSARRW